jgi:O-acetyl-ADP-ribose deacetylase (regulator of RNase III)
MTFEIIKGDLFDLSHNFDALAQGVNTKGKMGAGIAVPFREKWPDMYQEYKKLCTEFTDILPGLLHTWYNPNWNSEDPIQHIFNLFSQDWPGPYARYEWLNSATLLMRWEAENALLERVGLPWIGCGIGKLERHNVQHFFERILTPSTVEFVLVEQP